MKNKTIFITAFSAVIAISTCLLVHHASHSTDEAVRRRAVMAYYHTIGRSAEKREAARYLLDNMPYHYGVTVRDSKEVKRWAKETTETLRDLLDEYGLYQIPGDTIRALRDERRADSLAMLRIDKEVQSEFIPMMDGSQLTASSLIRHINHAFKVWRTSRFAKKLTFNGIKEELQSQNR